MKPKTPPLEYLMNCSREGLQSFRLAQLARDANCRKEIKEILEDWLESKALSLLSEWFDKHREELIDLAANPYAREELKRMGSLQDILNRAEQKKAS